MTAGQNRGPKLQLRVWRRRKSVPVLPGIGHAVNLRGNAEATAHNHLGSCSSCFILRAAVARSSRAGGRIVCWRSLEEIARFAQEQRGDGNTDWGAGLGYPTRPDRQD